jgi:hypothetical protein
VEPGKFGHTDIEALECDKESLMSLSGGKSEDEITVRNNSKDQVLEVSGRNEDSLGIGLQDTHVIFWHELVCILSLS